MKTVQELYRRGAARLSRLPQTDPALEARLILSKAASLTEREFLTYPDRPVSRPAEARFWRMIVERLERRPLAYVTGEREFWSLSFAVVPGVFIPRPETEAIVERIKALSSGQKEKIAEIGTGCGAIAVVLAKELPRAGLIATDISRKALRMARLNAARHGVSSVVFAEGSLFEPLDVLALKGRLHFLVSNPPYVAEKDWRLCQPEVRRYEPKKALVPGRSGLEFIRRLIQGAADYLRPSGYLLFEIGAGQADQVLSWLDSRWDHARVTDDLAGIPRVVECRRAR